MVEWGAGKEGYMINQTHFTLTTSTSRNGKSGEGGEKNQLGNCSVCVLRGAVPGRVGVVTSKLSSHI